MRCTIICGWGWDTCDISDHRLAGYLLVAPRFSDILGLMKMRACFFAVLSLTQAILTAQVSGGTPPEPPRYDRGVIANDTYTNDCLGFSLVLQQGWERSNPGVTDLGVALHLPGGGLSLLILSRHAATALGDSLSLRAVDTSPSPAITAEQYVTLSAQRQIQIDPQKRELTRGAYAIDYGGKRFFRADYKQSMGNNGPLYLGNVYTRFRGYLIGGALTASSPEALDEAANILQKIMFRDDQQNPACVPGTNDGLQPGVQFGVIGSVALSSSIKPGSHIRVSSGVSSGLLVQKVQPQYPEAARKEHIQGTVILGASINEKGDVETLTPVSGDPALVPAAMEAVKQWKYKPYLLNGTPMTIDTQVRIDFTLSAN